MDKNFENGYGNNFEKMDWISDLIRAEQSMEQAGIVDFISESDPERIMVAEGLRFLGLLKTRFTDAIEAFNVSKETALGRVKLYSIAKTHADFMLFRNSFKLIFALKQPGLVAVRFHYMGGPAMGAGPIYSSQTIQSLMDDDLLEAKWGAFGELIWTYHNQPISIEHLVKYYLTRFIRESAK